MSVIACLQQLRIQTPTNLNLLNPPGASGAGGIGKASMQGGTPETRLVVSVIACGCTTQLLNCTMGR